MNMHRIHIFISALILLFAGTSLSAQEKDLTAARENDIVTAVSLYNERDFKGAAAVLDGIISEAPDNDAAWY